MSRGVAVQAGRCVSIVSRIFPWTWFRDLETIDVLSEMIYCPIFAWCFSTGILLDNRIATTVGAPLDKFYPIVWMLLFIKWFPFQKLSYRALSTCPEETTCNCWRNVELIFFRKFSQYDTFQFQKWYFFYRLWSWELSLRYRFCNELEWKKYEKPMRC